MLYIRLLTFLFALLLSAPALAQVSPAPGIRPVGTPATGDMLWYDTNLWRRLAHGSSGECVQWNGSAIVFGSCGGSGTVTSVGLVLPAELSVTVTPITTSGSLTATWASASGRKFIASPGDGSSGAYTGRAMVAADVPTLAYADEGANADITSMSGLTGAIRAPTGVLDSNGNEIVLFAAGIASAVNEFTFTNAATGNFPIFSATGGDTDIGMWFLAKGTGTVDFDNAAGSSFQGLRIRSDSGTGFLTLQYNRSGSTDRTAEIRDGGTVPTTNFSVAVGNAFVCNNSTNATFIGHPMLHNVTPTTLTGNTTLTATSNPLQKCDTSGGGFTVTLAGVNTANKVFVLIVKTTSDANTVTVAGTVEGSAAGITLTNQYDKVLLWSSGVSAIGYIRLNTL